MRGRTLAVVLNWGGVAVVVLCTICAYWQLAVPWFNVTWFDHYDMCQLELPRLQFLAREFHRGVFPLWNPHSWSGQPVLGAAQPGPLYPLNLLFLLLPLKAATVPIETWNWWFLGIHVSAALTCYWLCRDLGLSKMAAVLGGTAFSCTGYLGSVPWIDVANGIVWIPAIFFGFNRLWHNREPRRAVAILSLAVGMSWLSGHHEIPLLSCYTIAALCSALVLADGFLRRRWNWRFGIAAAASLGVGGMIGAAQILPALEFARLSRRWVGATEPLRWWETVPYAVHTQYSLTWRDLIGLIVPTVTPEGHTTIFVGLAVMALAGLGCREFWRAQPIRLLVPLTVVGLLVALGATTPFHRLMYEWLPFMDKARTPVRAMSLATFGICVLAAYGTDAVLELKERTVKFCVTFLVTAAIALRYMYSLPGSTTLALGDLGRSTIVAAGTALLVAAWCLPSRKASFTLIALVLLESQVTTGRRKTDLASASTVCAGEIYQHRALAQTLRAELGSGRVAVNRDEVLTQLGELYGFDQLQGFVAAVAENVISHEFHTSRTQELFGVTHYVSKTAADPTDIEVATPADGVRLYRKARANPRVWISHDVVEVASMAALRAAIQRPDSNLGRTAFLRGRRPQLEQCPGSHVRSLAYPDVNHVDVVVQMGCRGIVVLSDAMYPGWRANIDGKQAVLIEINGSMRGVVVERGQHHIRMRYDPSIVKVGFATSAVGLLCVACALWLERRKVRVAADPPPMH